MLDVENQSQDIRRKNSYIYFFFQTHVPGRSRDSRTAGADGRHFIRSSFSTLLNVASQTHF
jgi:hypothetical protein